MRGVAVPSKNQMRVIGTIESSKHWQGDREEAKAQVLLLGVWPLWKVAQIESLTDELTKTEIKLLFLKKKSQFLCYTKLIASVWGQMWEQKNEFLNFGGADHDSHRADTAETRQSANSASSLLFVCFPKILWPVISSQMLRSG